MAAPALVNRGSAQGDVSAESLFTAFGKINDNFTAFGDPTLYAKAASLGTMASQSAANVAITGGSGSFGTLGATNLITSSGASSGFQWEDRTTSSVKWALYATGGVMSLWNTSSAAVISIAQAGDTTILKSFKANAVGSDYRLAVGNRVQLVGNNETYVLGISYGSGKSPVYLGPYDSSTVPGFGAYNNAGTRIFGVDSNGNGVFPGTCTATSFPNGSDHRLKENIRDLDGALDRIVQLHPVFFDWIDETRGKNAEGFIAHELQAVMPYPVFGQKDAVDDDGNPVYQTVDYSRLVPTLTAALKELKAQNDALVARVAALEAKSA